METERLGSPLAPFAWMSLGAILFALMNFLARIASAHVSWTLVAGTRALVGAFVAMAIARGRGVPFLPKSTRTMWLRSFFGTIAMVATFYALGSKALALGDTVTLVNLTPVFLALLAPHVLGERSGRRVVIAIPLAVVGVVLILRPTFVFGEAGAHVNRDAMLFPAGIAVLASVSSSFAMMMLRRVGKTEHPEAIATHFSLVAAATCFLLSLPSLEMPSRIDLLTMLVTGVCAGCAQIAMTKAYAMEHAARVSPFGYLSVVVSAALGAGFLHEWPSLLALAGMALVILAGTVVTLAGVRERRRNSTLS
jgi:drug/metabolite transporter (DMT)-like permease